MGSAVRSRMPAEAENVQIAVNNNQSAITFVAKSANFNVPTFIWHIDVQKLHDRTSDFRRLNGSDSATLCRNLVRFVPVTSEFTTLECVQQALVITSVSSCTIARGRSIARFLAISKRLCLITIR